MSIAPSERHLEDWIVAHNPFNLKLIDRQLAVPSGVIDLLYANEHGALVIMELKKGRIDDHAVGQMARYAADFDGFIWSARRELAKSRTISQAEASKLRNAEYQLDPELWLIGHGSPGNPTMDSLSRMSRHAAKALQYEYEAAAYVFTPSQYDWGGVPLEKYERKPAVGVLRAALNDHVFAHLNDLRNIEASADRYATTLRRKP